jgi:hypothetical protein
MARINVTQTAKITAALDAAQGRATARTISPEDLVTFAAEAEKQMEKAGIPKALRKGATLRILPARVANAYQYAAEGTSATLERGSTDWYLISASRGHCGHCSYGGYGRTQLEMVESPELTAALYRGAGITARKPEEK